MTEPLQHTLRCDITDPDANTEVYVCDKCPRRIEVTWGKPTTMRTLKAGWWWIRHTYGKGGFHPSRAEIEPQA